jgi:hypothetical protein
VLEREEGGLEGPEAFAEWVIQPERLRHVRQHLQETGRAVQLAALQQRVIQDVSREVPEYQEQLRAHGKRAVREALARRVLALHAFET